MSSKITIFACALAIVIASGATAILLSVLVKEPNDDLREGIKNLYWIAGFGAAAIIGMATSMRFD